MYSVVAPSGAFGNHLRTLLLLSKEFKWDNMTTDDKVTFIKQNLYFADRSWQNWLDVEWTHRIKLNEILLFSHDLKTVLTNTKSIVLVSDPNLCLRCYIKFNSNLNIKSFDEFKGEIEKYNNLANKMFVNHPNIALVLNSDALFNEQLDEQLYNKCIEFLNVEDCYQQAKDIHVIWYNLHIKAEKDFVQFFTSFYKFSN